MATFFIRKRERACMFLALKEMKKEKTRFLMIILTTALIAYLVYFLSSLAYGLAQINRTAIDQWDAEGVVLSKDANGNILSSFYKRPEEKWSKDLEVLKLENVVAYLEKDEDEEEPMNFALMNVDMKGRLISPLTEGRLAEKDDEIVLSQTVLDKVDLKLHDKIKLAGHDGMYEIVGLTDDANFNTVPVAYLDYHFDDSKHPAEVISALVNFDEDFELQSNDYKYYDTKDFINNLPGYKAQVLTFSLMIIALSLVATIIIGIFMYILTMQKKSVFGVLKIQGYQNRYIMNSVMLQTLMVVLIGVGLGFALTQLTLVFLPASVPVAINLKLYFGVTLFIVLSSLVGALFSALSILKIDPLDSI